MIGECGHCPQEGFLNYSSVAYNQGYYYKRSSDYNPSWPTPYISSTAILECFVFKRLFTSLIKS